MPYTMQTGMHLWRGLSLTRVRAAAYSHLNQHEKAIEDCKVAVQRNPAYGKAYSRMGYVTRE